MLLTEMPRPITRRFQNREVGGLTQFRIERAGRDSEKMPAFVATGEETGAADPAGGRRDERVFEAHALFRKPVDVWCLHDRMTGAAESVVPLIVGVKEQNVRT